MNQEPKAKTQYPKPSSINQNLEYSCNGHLAGYFYLWIRKQMKLI
jgi:hypothetical protein